MQLATYEQIHSLLNHGSYFNIIKITITISYVYHAGIIYMKDYIKLEYNNQNNNYGSYMSKQEFIIKKLQNQNGVQQQGYYN